MSTDEPLPEYSAWLAAERSRMIGYIFGLLDAAKSDRLLIVGLEDGIQFQSPWSGERWTIRFELEPTDYDLTDVPDWAKAFYEPPPGRRPPHRPAV